MKNIIKNDISILILVGIIFGLWGMYTDLTRLVDINEYIYLHRELYIELELYSVKEYEFIYEWWYYQNLAAKTVLRSSYTVTFLGSSFLYISNIFLLNLAQNATFNQNIAILKLVFGDVDIENLSKPYDISKVNFTLVEPIVNLISFDEVEIKSNSSSEKGFDGISDTEEYQDFFTNEKSIIETAVEEVDVLPLNLNASNISGFTKQFLSLEHVAVIMKDLKSSGDVLSYLNCNRDLLDMYSAEEIALFLKEICIQSNIPVTVPTGGSSLIKAYFLDKK